MRVPPVQLLTGVFGVVVISAATITSVSPFVSHEISSEVEVISHQSID